MPTRKITVTVKDLGETDLTIERPDVSDEAMAEFFGKQEVQEAIQAQARAKLESQRAASQQAAQPAKVEVEGAAPPVPESAKTYGSSIKAGLKSAQASGSRMLQNAFQTVGDVEKAVEGVTGIKNITRYEPNRYLANKIAQWVGVPTPNEDDGFTGTANELKPITAALDAEAAEAAKTSKSGVLQGVTQAVASMPVAIGAMKAAGPIAGGAALGWLSRYHEGVPQATVGAVTGGALGAFNQQLSVLPLRQRILGNAGAGGLGVAASGDLSPEGLAFGTVLGGATGLPGGKPKVQLDTDGINATNRQKPYFHYTRDEMAKLDAMASLFGGKKFVDLDEGRRARVVEALKEYDTVAQNKAAQPEPEAPFTSDAETPSSPPPNDSSPPPPRTEPPPPPPPPPPQEPPQTPPQPESTFFTPPHEDVPPRTETNAGEPPAGDQPFTPPPPPPPRGKSSRSGTTPPKESNPHPKWEHKTQQGDARPHDESRVADQLAREGIPTVEGKPPRNSQGPESLSNPRNPMWEREAKTEVPERPEFAGTKRRPTYHSYDAGLATLVSNAAKAAAQKFPNAAQAATNAATDVKNAAGNALASIKRMKNRGAVETGLDLRKKNLDASTPLAQAEVMAGQRKALIHGDPADPFNTMVPDSGALGRQGTMDKSPVEAFGNYLAGTSGKVRGAFDAVEGSLSKLVEFDGDLSQFGDWMTAERLNELAGKNPQYKLPTGWDTQRVQDTLATMAAHPKRAVFEQAADGLRGISDDLLDQSVDAGLLHPNARDAMKANNAKYAPFERVEKIIGKHDPNDPLQADKFAASMSQSKTKTFNPIDMEGSDLEVGDPINGFLRQYETRIHQIERAKAVNSYTDMVDQFGDEGNIGIGRRGYDNPGDPNTGPVQPIQPGEGVIYKWENGQPLPYFVPENIVDAYSVMNRAQMGTFGNMMTALSRGTSHMATTNPVYVARNMWRDFSNVHMNSPVPYTVTDALGGLFTQIDALYFKGKLSGGKSTAIVDQMRREGASGGGFSTEGKGIGEALQNTWDSARGRKSQTPGGPLPSVHRDYAAPEASFLTLNPREFMEAGRIAKKRVVLDPIGQTARGIGRGVKAITIDVWNTPMSALAELSENMGRTGLWKRLGDELDPTTGKPFTADRRAYITNTMATNFQMRGTSREMDQLYRMIPFLRARMLGMMTSTDNMASKATSDPSKFAAAAAFAAIPAITFHLWNNTNFPDVAKELSAEDKASNYIYIYGNHKNEDGVYDQVIKLPKEGWTRGIANAVDNFMDIAKDSKANGVTGKKVAAGYGNLAAQFLSDVFSPTDIYSDGKVTPEKAVRGLVPPQAAAGMDILANRDIRLERPLWSGDKQIPSSRAFVTESPGGLRNTSMLSRAASSAAANVFGEKSYEDILGRAVSPVAIEHGIRSMAGPLGMGAIRAWDPATGAANSWLTKRLASAQFQGDVDYPQTPMESLGPAARVVDFRRSFGTAYPKPDQGTIGKAAESAVSQGAAMRKEVRGAVDYMISRKAYDKKPGETPQARATRLGQDVRTAFSRHKMGPEDAEEFARVTTSKLISTAEGFDTISRAIQHMDNRQKAIFIDELTRNPETRGPSKSPDGKEIPAGPRFADLMNRLKKMMEDGELTEGVLKEVQKLQMKHKRNPQGVQ